VLEVGEKRNIWCDTKDYLRTLLRWSHSQIWQWYTKYFFMTLCCVRHDGHMILWFLLSFWFPQWSEKNILNSGGQVRGIASRTVDTILLLRSINFINLNQKLHTYDPQPWYPRLQ
jgi:hypothetical protein